MSSPQFGGFDPENGAVLLRGPFGAPYKLEAKCTTFKMSHGDYIVARKGPFVGKTAVVVGELGGNLWLYTVEDGNIAPIKYCANFSELLEKHDFQVVQAPRGFVSITNQLGTSEYLDTASVFDNFGVRPGERLHLKSFGKNCTIAGSLYGCLWIKFDNDRSVGVPLPMVNSGESLSSMYGVCEPVDQPTAELIPSPRKTPRSGGAPAIAVDSSRQIAVCAGAFGNSVELDISPKALRDFAVTQGQRFMATRGLMQGKMCTVAGVQGGNLWVLPDGERRVVCCRNCEDAADLHEQYGFEVSFSRDKPKNKADTPPAKAPQTPAKSVVKNVAEDPASPTTVRPPRKFKCWTAFGRFDFDSTEAACKKYGFYHQQSVKATQGPEAGNVFHIIGERLGSLWALPEGKLRAVSLTHCPDSAAIKERYGFVVTGKKSLAHLQDQVVEPPLTPMNSPRPRLSQSPERTLSTSPARPQPAVPALNFGSALKTTAEYEPVASNSDGDRLEEAPWAPGRMPATRHYLKAVAMLKQGGGANQSAFHQYYMRESASRIAGALSKIEAFRSAWVRSEAARTSAFSNATPEEMLTVMRENREIFV